MHAMRINPGTAPPMLLGVEGPTPSPSSTGGSRLPLAAVVDSGGSNPGSSVYGELPARGMTSNTTFPTSGRLHAPPSPATTQAYLGAERLARQPGNDSHDPMHTVGSQEGAVSYERGPPVPWSRTPRCTPCASPSAHPSPPCEGVRVCGCEGVRV